MARRISLTTPRRMSDINLTSMMDLTFLLLITFIITFPMMEQGIPVNLPKGKADPTRVENSKAISIDAKGQIFLDAQPVTLDELAQQIPLMVGSDPNLIIRVRGDENMRYGAMVEVMRILHDAKVTRMALVTQEGGGR